MLASGLRVPEAVVSYTAELLADEDMTLPDTLFEVLEAGVAETTKFGQLHSFKRIGDAGLIIAGPFRASISTKNTTVDYYRDLSAIGYRCAGNLSGGQIYTSLEANVTAVTDILHHFWERLTADTLALPQMHIF